ncbi:hypothetical protein [Thalassospira sp.]|uniref:hypothetical protein n=1 Tax=Thalassospira sp. TaxID=1912094 RepID=UPI001B0FED20|nr:hypothetical protein [Thalassospira sp.]MBO6773842.1 hypothetical protein [Thalassospira sp.]
MMLTDVVPFSRSDVQLVQSILQTPDAVITSAALDGFHGHSAEPLKESGVLRPDGHQLAAVSLSDHDDEAVNLSWSPEHRGYGYFSPSAGWVPVSGDQLTAYTICFPDLFQVLLAPLDVSSREAPEELVRGLIWEVGDVRLPGRGKRVPVWISRRLHAPEVWSMFADAARSRPSPGLRLVINLTPGRVMEPTYRGHEIISLQDVICADGLAVDPDLLAARVSSGATTADAPIIVTADGASVNVRGKHYPFTGTKQRSIIRHLYQAWKSGEPECLTAAVLEAAECGASVNTLAKAFSGRSDWRDFIQEKNGRCWISL